MQAADIGRPGSGNVAHRRSRRRGPAESTSTDNLMHLSSSGDFKAEDPMEQMVGAPLPSQEESTRAQRGRAVGLQNTKLRKIMKLNGPAREKALKKHMESISTSTSTAVRGTALQNEATSVNDAKLAATRVHIIRLFSEDEINKLAQADKALAKARVAPSIREYPSSDFGNQRNELPNLKKRKQVAMAPDSQVDDATMGKMQPLLGKLGLARAAGTFIVSEPRGKAQPNPRQHMHSDFSQLMIRHHREARPPGEKSTHPWTLLLFITRGLGHVYVQLPAGTPVKLTVSAGCAVLFRGDVIHAGAAYQTEHMRAHWYLVPKSTSYEGIKHTDDWRTSEHTGEVVLHEEDLLHEWSNKHDKDTAYCEPAGVVYHTPRECSIEEAVATIE